MSMQNHPFDSAVIGSISVSAARIIPASVSYGYRGSDVHVGPVAGETILLRLALRRVVSFEVFGDLRSVSTSAGADGAAAVQLYDGQTLFASFQALVSAAYDEAEDRTEIELKGVEDI